MDGNPVDISIANNFKDMLNNCHLIYILYEDNTIMYVNNQTGNYFIATHLD